MYSKDDIDLQKTYQQVNEMLGRSHAKLIGSTILGKLGSEKFKQKARNISLANHTIEKLKYDAEKQGKNINDPRFLDEWVFSNFGFRPKDLGVEYTPKQTQSDYIRYALAAREAAKQERKLLDREKALANQDTETVSEPPEMSDEEYNEIMGPSDEPDLGSSTKEAPEKPEYQKTLETAPQKITELQKELDEIRKQKKELESQQASVGATAPTPNQEYISKLEQENSTLKRELSRIAKENLANTPVGQRLKAINQARYSNDQWKRTPSKTNPDSFANYFDERGNYIKPT